MTAHKEKLSIATKFHAALVSKDWAGIHMLLTDDASWILPGENRISGLAEGPEAVVARAKLIAGFNLSFELKHVLVSRDNMALSLHNTANRGGLILDEHLSTVCRLQHGKIAFIETFLSDLEGMNAFFA